MSETRQPYEEDPEKISFHELKRMMKLLRALQKAKKEGTKKDGQKTT